MVGTTTALLIGAGLSAGGQAAGAAMNSSASKSAAKTQAASDKEALALQERMYQQDRSDLGQTREDLAPFRALGGGAAGLLGQGLGVNMTPPESKAGPWAQTSGSIAKPMSSLMPQVTPNEAMVADRMNVDNPAGKIADLQAMRGLPQAAAQQNSQSGYVQILAPNGKVGNVPASMVDKAIAMGGRRVS